MCMNMEEKGNVYTCLDVHTQGLEKGRCSLIMQMEKEDRHMGRGMHISIGTMT